MKTILFVILCYALPGSAQQKEPYILLPRSAELNKIELPTPDCPEWPALFYEDRDINMKFDTIVDFFKWAVLNISPIYVTYALSSDAIQECGCNRPFTVVAGNYAEAICQVMLRHNVRWVVKQYDDIVIIAVPVPCNE